MIRVYQRANQVLEPVAFPEDGVLPPRTVWIDMLSPTPEEERRVEQALEIDAPTREEMQEIELSNRLYREGAAIYLTANVINASDTDDAETTAVTFIRTPRALVTLRYADPLSFRSFSFRAMRQPGLCNGVDMTMVSIIESVVNRSADVLERVGARLDQLSKRVFIARTRGRGGRRQDAGEEDVELEEALKTLGRLTDQTALVRECLMSFGRLLTYYNQVLMEEKAGKDLRLRGKSLHRDVLSLTEHADSLAHKSSFLLDATLGLINIQQTNIIKIFSVAATVFLPPTLIASIYGMNYEVMPELSWEWGYPFSIGLMVLSAIVPFWYFKRRGWL